MVYLLKMVIFYSYVKLPEGRKWVILYMWRFPFRRGGYLQLSSSRHGWPWISIETYSDLGILHFKRPPCHFLGYVALGHNWLHINRRFIGVYNHPYDAWGWDSSETKVLKHGRKHNLMAWEYNFPMKLPFWSIAGSWTNPKSRIAIALHL